MRPESSPGTACVDFVNSRKRNRDSGSTEVDCIQGECLRVRLFFWNTSFAIPASDSPRDTRWSGICRAGHILADHRCSKRWNVARSLGKSFRHRDLDRWWIGTRQLCVGARAS